MKAYGFVESGFILALKFDDKQLVMLTFYLGGVIIILGI